MRVKNIDEADIDTVLSEDIEFEGELVFHDPLLIKGSAVRSVPREISS
jgi:cytoskeletal protein CcmA (bactofilin family)